ncbi:MAG: class I SAM-dependent methyltransferase [Gammaproteobacteria bacterium]|nr:class I SAM-dependent methyltransferase [Gammaproteobacteria bacterium]NIR98682.1 class I SAM-dependent methyltransferase [Gammaproteobacteria bacterium]NIT64394.1 class I SAM-dependent methyltransferase [Gammaproteobacteria bacterium]NIV19493.1 methyltransferase domain-containing protein [Gammaproteobacteria bacterium]NIY32974.1 methyltransferase domain-containing protein [Gammaproteobacteria bacterium]
MHRIPEPELMDAPAQAHAYAHADFEAPHGRFIELLRERLPGLDLTGPIVDLGCGPADITIRVARVFPRCRIDGVDGAAAMLEHARGAVARAGLGRRIRLIHGLLPGVKLAEGAYAGVISNSLLHHLHDPAVLWASVDRCARPGAAVFAMDLMRPDDPEQATALVERHSGDEPEILKRDFYNSLRAAFRVEEVKDQLRVAGLAGLHVAAVSDRHLAVYGRLPRP